MRGRIARIRHWSYGAAQDRPNRHRWISNQGFAQFQDASLPIGLNEHIGQHQRGRVANWQSAAQLPIDDYRQRQHHARIHRHTPILG